MKRSQLLPAIPVALIALVFLFVNPFGDDGPSPSLHPETEQIEESSPAPGSLPPGPGSEEEVTPTTTERAAIDDGLRDLSALVLDQATDAPLAGVPVHLTRTEPAWAAEGLSDANGRVSFEGLEPGDYALSPGPLGDLDYRADPTSLVVAEPDLEEVELRVERRWFLAGHVVEVGTRVVVPDVGLTGRTAAGRRSYLGTSDHDGHFRSRRSFVRGPVTLHLSEGDTEGLVRTSGEGPELLRVAVGEEDVAHLTVEVDWVGVLNGVVLDPREIPIPGALVRVLTADSIYLRNADLRFWALYEAMADRGRTERTDDEGRFSFRRLPNDRTLVLVASASGHASGRSPELPPPFLESGERIELRLEFGGDIVGRVLGAGENPVEEATVSALVPDAEYQTDPDRTDELGAFRLTGLRPGVAEVTASARADGGRPYVIATGKVEVVAGSEVELILRSGEDGVHLSGVVVDQFGEVVTGDRRRLSLRTRPLDPLPGERSWGSDTPIQADGTFNVTVAREAEYNLILLGNLVGDRYASQAVHAPAHDLRLVFEMVPTSELTVRVLDASTGELIQRGDIGLSWDRGSIGGNFFGGEPSYQVRGGTYTVTVDAEGYAPSSQELDLSGPLGAETLVEMRLDRGRALTGRVVDAAGDPVKGCAVVLRLGGMLQIESLVYSGTDGCFVIESAPITGGSVCVIDEDYRTLAATEIDEGEVVLTLEGD